MSDVFYMKLTNGEDIICKIEKEDNENQMYFISNPLKVSYNFVAENNRMSMGLSYWIPLADGEEDEVLEEYLNEVNSDISKKLISANTVH